MLSGAFRVSAEVFRQPQAQRQQLGVCALARAASAVAAEQVSRVRGQPVSLEVAPPTDDAEVSAKRASGLKQLLLRMSGFWSRESAAIRGSRKLYAAAEAQALDAVFLQNASLDPHSFQAQQSALVLHMWMLMRRLRTDGEDGKRVSQPLHDIFQAEVERRVHEVGVRVRVNKWLRELESVFYGISLALDSAYDEGTSADLTHTLFKNVYLSDDSKARASEELAVYTERELDSLFITPSSAFLSGNIAFSRWDGAHIA